MRNEKVDELCRQCIADAGKYFELDPVFRRVKSNLGPVPTHPLLDMENVVEKHVKDCLRLILREKKNGLRQFENYATGIGPRRYQIIDSFSATELRTAASGYKKNEVGNRITRLAYEEIADKMERLGVPKLGEARQMAEDVIQRWAKDAGQA